MPTMAQHIELANRNQAILDYLLRDTALCAETIAITAFYKSLHVMEAVFHSRENRHFHNHADRDDHIKKRRDYNYLWVPYRALSSASYVARYLSDNQSQRGYARFVDYLPPHDIRPLLLDGYLYRFEHLAAQLLPQNHGLNLYVKSIPVPQPHVVP